MPSPKQRYELLRSLFTPLTRKEAPHIVEYVEQICLTNGIHKPPLLLKADFLRNSYALADEDAIVIGSHLLDKATDTHALAEIAHEISHLLHGDKGSSRKKIELRADRTAATLLGSNAPMKDFRTWTHEHSDSTRISNILPENTWSQRLQKWAVTKAEDLHRNVSYGSPATVIQNIKTNAVHDRSHVERLITERNQASVDKKIK